MPKNLLSPEDVASILRVDPDDVLELIDEGTLRAYKIGKFVRIAEDDIDRCLEACSTGEAQIVQLEPRPSVELAQRNSGERLCKTFAGRKTFRVSGHVETGAEIWAGDMRYPIRFSKEKFDALLKWGQSRREIRAGASFSGPEEGSLGQWIQKNLPTKLNPSCYVAGLLIDEGYAERARAGVIRFYPTRQGHQ